MLYMVIAHRVVRLAVHCTVFPLIVDEDVVELRSFSIGLCVCPKLSFLFWNFVSTSLQSFVRSKGKLPFLLVYPPILPAR